eukprot:scaffold1244_cov162-Ochromonas_danica.AAC.55
MDLTAIIVTSPFVSLPSTAIISYSIESFNQIEGLEEAPVIIIMDGYQLSEENRPKKGRITQELAALYDQYHEALLARFSSPRFSVWRSEKHLGFAYAVKAGLELCRTTYALIAQHDRCFTQPFTRLPSLLKAMDEDPHIRYIGFPTNSSMRHENSIEYRYRLTGALRRRLPLEDGLSLQPLIFWFDSQHLAHVKRYLEIYKPYRNLPADLRQLIGIRAIADMLLRPGDFIEDRFGQAERNILSRLRAEDRPVDEIEKVFRWFGSYLCWPYDECDEGEMQPLVSHLDGRRLDMQKLAGYNELYGEGRFKTKSYLRLREVEQRRKEQSASSESSVTEE